MGNSSTRSPFFRWNHRGYSLYFGEDRASSSLHRVPSKESHRILLPQGKGGAGSCHLAVCPDGDALTSALTLAWPAGHPPRILGRRRNSSCGNVQLCHARNGFREGTLLYLQTTTPDRRARSYASRRRKLRRSSLERDQAEVQLRWSRPGERPSNLLFLSDSEASERELGLTVHWFTGSRY